MRLVVALFLCIVGTHYLGDILASGYENKLAASKSIFYVLRGFEGAFLFFVIAWLTKFAPIRRAYRQMAIAVCAWGAFEECSTAVCRLALPLDVRATANIYSGICGQSSYTVGLIVASCFAAMMAWRSNDD